MMNKTEITLLIVDQLNFLSKELRKDEKLSSVLNKQIQFLKDLAGIKSVYMRDIVKNEDYEFFSHEDMYQFICECIGYKFDKNLIYKNKSRKMKVCQRFYVSDDPSFSFLKTKKSIPDTELLKQYGKDRLNKKWFKSRTRIL